MFYRKITSEFTRFSIRFPNNIVVVVELTDAQSPDAKVMLYEQGIRGDYPVEVKLPEFQFKKQDEWYHHITAEELLQIMNAAAGAVD